jgi:tetratricopeptide (TPR) repeat protein
VIHLDTRNCLTGEVLAQQEEVVDRPEYALRGLEKATTRLREQLGESLSSIQKFDVPLELATTSSLEALQAYSFARQKLADGGDPWEAFPHLVRATELDPNFAMAHAALGEIYSSGGPMSNDELGRRYLNRAFELRDRVSEHEKFYIVSSYYENVTRELGKAVDNYELWKWTYPRDVEPYNGLAVLHISTGQFEEAAEAARTALFLRPRRAQSYERLAFIYTNLDRFNEAKAYSEQAVAQKIDGPRTHWRIYIIAFLQNDITAMQKELDWARARGETTRVPFYQALAAAANGKLRRSEQLFRETMDDRLADHDKEGAALAAVQLALIEAHFGYPSRARFRAAESLKLLSANTDLGSLALAAAGDDVAAKRSLQRLVKTFPRGTLLTNVVVPIISSQCELNHNRPLRAIEFLRAAQRYDFGADNAGRGLMAIYLRGQAFLRMHAGKEAQAEFQQVIDHSGIDPFSPLHALAYLGRARAYALGDDRERTRDAYKAFFTRWNGADADLPVLVQAKAEYSKLQ